MRFSRFFIVALLLAGLAAVSVPARADDVKLPSKYCILVLNSYHHGYAWSDNIMKGLRQELAAQHVSADLYLDYLDTKRTGRLAVLESLRLLQTKYKNKRFDVVITADNFAFTFALDHRQELFPDTPMVFCGVNDFDPSRLQGVPATGVVENSDVAATLRLAQELHPDVDRVVVVGDNSVTGRAIRAQVRDAEKELSPGLRFEYVEGSLRTILERLRGLGSSDIVFSIPFYAYEGNASNGWFYDASEVQELIAKASNRPVYSTWAFQLGHDSVGGKLISGVEQGRLVGELAVQVLRGAPVESIPIIRKSNNLYMFDYNQLKRWSVSQSLLPADSIIVNAPKAFYEVDKDLFWLGLFCFVLLSGLSILLIVNVARRRRIAERLKSQLSFLEILMDAIPQLVSWKDSRQRYLGANRSFANFFGLEEPADVIQLADDEFIRATSFVKWAATHDRQVLRTQEPLVRARVSLRDPHQANDGDDMVWLEINKVPLYDLQGRAVGTLSTAENVTREVELEQQLLRSQKMEAIGALAGGVAHDFNNILTSIINSTELALMDVEKNSDTGMDLGRVLKAADRGKRLVEQIMTFSRPSQEGFRPTNLAELVREIVALLTPSIPCNILVVAKVDPEVEKAGKILVDPTQIHQVLMNLCTNAYQAMRGAGGQLTVSLSLKDLGEEEAGALNMRPGPCLRLTVADTGPGVDPAIADKIFDPFFTTKGKHEGTGLGLAVVLGVVKNHCGSVRLLRETGEEVVFEVLLPATHALDGEAAAAPRALGDVKARLLFVEDDRDQLAATPRILKGFGFETVAVEGAAEALDVLERRSFDLVLTDFDMPGKSGVQLAKEIGLRWPGLPILLISGRSQAAAAAEGVSNVAAVLAKPYTGRELSDAIRQALAGLMRDAEQACPAAVEAGAHALEEEKCPAS
ncbi:MAG: ATP-binding protein [Desulfovibrionaceae bacterium]